MRRQYQFALAVAICLVAMCSAQELKVPASAVAGIGAAIGTSGNGTATFYLIGPSVTLKRELQLGQDVSLAPKELQSAGRYIAIVCSGECRNASFFVSPAKPVSLAFLVHPSRAPVGLNDVISGVALTFDEFQNMVLTPTTVNFQWSTKDAAPASRQVSTHDGAAWFRASSGRTAGALQVTASFGDVSTRRVVQQVASEPCRLSIKGQRTPKGIVVETDPVRDCTGNPVPDGTIVTFTAKNGKDTDTVDAPIKQGVARAQLSTSGPVVVSAASGVVMGNELRVGQ